MENEKSLSPALCEAIVSWFRSCGRILPWREGRDPYRIWISEVMLQQTRIEAVIPYYHRFLRELPSIRALADCPEEKLLKLWEGLGYYSRARNLKKAAMQIEEKHGGRMPQDEKALRALAGIGDYTAGAIASIAFGLPCPAVDGNVLRVMTRLLGDESDVLLAETKKKIAKKLMDIYPSGRAAGDLTEGIMEIGERICIPNGAPLCEMCPVKDFCTAHREDLTDRIPKRSPKKPRKTVEMTVFLLTHEDKAALRRRSETGLLAGMWEFYHCEGAFSKNEAQEHLKEQGLEPRAVKKLGKSRHVFTHLEWEMTLYRAECAVPSEKLVWLKLDEIKKDCAIPTAFQAALRALTEKE